MRRPSKELPIWIVQVGEPVPHDATRQNDRLFRSGILAKYLADAGSEVVWWTSTMDHARKCKRFESFQEVEIRPRLKVAFLNGCLYQRNLSVNRIVNHIQLARQFRQRLHNYPKPGIMVLNYPTPELCDEGVRFGRKAGIPTVVDIRDLWPDDIINVCPGPLRLVARMMTLPMRRMARRVFRGANNLVGVTSGYLDWGTRMGERSDEDNHRVFHLAYANPNPPKAIVKMIDDDTATRTVSSIRLVFAGMLGVSVEMKPVFEAVRVLRSRGCSVYFDICGKGDKYDVYQREFGSVEGFEFHGFVDHAYLDRLLLNAHFGVLPYLNHGSLGRNIPNKVGEYLSYGLPILSTLSGASAEVIETESVGAFFDPMAESTPADIANYITNSLEYRDEWRERRLRCQRVYAMHFDARQVYANFGQWIRGLARAN